MEDSILYSLVDVNNIYRWKKQAEKEEAFYVRKEQKALEALKAGCSEIDEKLLTLYSIAVENRILNINNRVQTKVLHLGVKIGMQLQADFAEYTEDDFILFPKYAYNNLFDSCKSDPEND